MTREVSPSVWVLRAVLVVALLVALLSGLPSGYHPAVALVVVVAVGAVVAGLYPDGLAPTIVMVVVTAWWTFHLHGAVPAGLLVAAAGLTVAHVVATLLAYGPPSLEVDRRLVLMWAGRGALSWLAALVVWVAARAYVGHATPALFWLTGLTAAVVGSVVVGQALSPSATRAGMRGGEPSA
ncbi:MAG: hypothetical protein QM747_12405 [Nocardioides sp.]